MLIVINSARSCMQVLAWSPITISPVELLDVTQAKSLLRIYPRWLCLYAGGYDPQGKVSNSIDLFFMSHATPATPTTKQNQSPATTYINIRSWWVRVGERAPESKAVDKGDDKDRNSHTHFININNSHKTDWTEIIILLQKMVIHSNNSHLDSTHRIYCHGLGGGPQQIHTYMCMPLGQSDSSLPPVCRPCHAETHVYQL